MKRTLSAKELYLIALICFVLGGGIRGFSSIWGDALIWLALITLIAGFVATLEKIFRRKKPSKDDAQE